MFTFQKLALVAAAGFAALAMSCSDDGDDGDDKVVIPLPSGFDHSENSVVLGGSTSNTGSFLDIDAKPFKVYTLNEAAANKNKIDLFFDGTNFKTPDGATSGFGSTQLAGSTSGALFCVIPASKTISTPQQVVDFLYDCLENDNETTAAQVTSNGAYAVLTSDQPDDAVVAALVKVGGEVGDEITLGIGRVSIPVPED
jgi:hypothetical protein